MVDLNIETNPAYCKELFVYLTIKRVQDYLRAFDPQKWLDSFLSRKAEEYHYDRRYNGYRIGAEKFSEGLCWHEVATGKVNEP